MSKMPEALTEEEQVEWSFLEQNARPGPAEIDGMTLAGLCLGYLTNIAALRAKLAEKEGEQRNFVELLRQAAPNGPGLTLLGRLERLVEREARAHKKAAEVERLKGADAERRAQIAEHRACCGSEHNPAAGKLHGYCVVCGVPWPCEYAGPLPKEARAALGDKPKGESDG